MAVSASAKLALLLVNPRLASTDHSHLLSYVQCSSVHAFLLSSPTYS